MTIYANTLYTKRTKSLLSIKENEELKKCIKTSRGIVIVTMDLITARKFAKDTGIAPIQLKSNKSDPTFRAWLPKRFTGQF